MLDEKKIKEQAKVIMDEFIKALDEVPEIKGDIGYEREENMRTPGEEEEEGFRDRLLKNFPKKKGGYLVAEKKKW